MTALRMRGGASPMSAEQAARVVLAKHSTVIPSTDPRVDRKPAVRAEVGPVTVGARNIARLLSTGPHLSVVPERCRSGEQT